MEMQNPLQSHAEILRQKISEETLKYLEAVKNNIEFSEAKTIREKINELQAEADYLLQQLSQTA